MAVDPHATPLETRQLPLRAAADRGVRLEERLRAGVAPAEGHLEAEEALPCLGRTEHVLQRREPDALTARDEAHEELEVADVAASDELARRDARDGDRDVPLGRNVEGVIVVERAMDEVMAEPEEIVA